MSVDVLLRLRLDTSQLATAKSQIQQFVSSTNAAISSSSKQASSGLLGQVATLAGVSGPVSTAGGGGVSGPLGNAKAMTAELKKQRQLAAENVAMWQRQQQEINVAFGLTRLLRQEEEQKGAAINALLNRQRKEEAQAARAALTFKRQQRQAEEQQAAETVAVLRRTPGSVLNPLAPVAAPVQLDKDLKFTEQLIKLKIRAAQAEQDLAAAEKGSDHERGLRRSLIQLGIRQRDVLTYATLAGANAEKIQALAAVGADKVIKGGLATLDAATVKQIQLAQRVQLLSPRLLHQAVGWTLVYGAIRAGGEVVTGAIHSMLNMDTAIAIATGRLQTLRGAFMDLGFEIRALLAPAGGFGGVRLVVQGTADALQDIRTNKEPGILGLNRPMTTGLLTALFGPTIGLAPQLFPRGRQISTAMLSALGAPATAPASAVSVEERLRTEAAFTARMGAAGPLAGARGESRVGQLRAQLQIIEQALLPGAKGDQRLGLSTEDLIKKQAELNQQIEIAQITERESVKRLQEQHVLKVAALRMDELGVAEVRQEQELARQALFIDKDRLKLKEAELAVDAARFTLQQKLIDINRQFAIDRAAAFGVDDVTQARMRAGQVALQRPDDAAALLQATRDVQLAQARQLAEMTTQPLREGLRSAFHAAIVDNKVDIEAMFKDIGQRMAEAIVDHFVIDKLLNAVTPFDPAAQQMLQAGNLMLQASNNNLAAAGQAPTGTGLPTGGTGSRGAGLQQAAMIGVAGLSTVAGLRGIQRGGGAGLMQGALAGLPLAFSLGAINPMLGIAAGVGAAAFGFFRRRKSVDVQSINEVLQVTSKIDITNKQLMIINRSLVALKASFEGFVLPESMFFSARRTTTLTDQILLNSQMGIQP